MRAQKCQGRKSLYSLGNSWGRGEPGVPVLLYGRQESTPPPIALSSQFSDLAGYWLSQHSDGEFLSSSLTVPPRVGRGTPWYLERSCHPLLEGLS